MTLQRLCAELQGFSDTVSRFSGKRRVSKLEDVPPFDSYEPLELEWVVDGLVPSDAITLLCGESGGYKTWIALLIACAVASGSGFYGRATHQRPVLYIDLENGLAGLQKRFQILRRPAPPALRIWGMWDDDPPPPIGDQRLVRIAQATKPFIVLDSFIRFHSADENKASDMGRVMRDLRLLSSQGASVLILHHTAKTESSEYRGSSDIKAGVDVAHIVHYDKAAKIVELSSFKNRFGSDLKLRLRNDLESSGSFELCESGSSDQHSDLRQIEAVISNEPGIVQGAIVERLNIPAARVQRLLSAYEGKLWKSSTGAHNRHHYNPVPQEKK